MVKDKMPKQISPYIEIARIDHWFKNIFMIPGIVLGFFITNFTIDFIDLFYRIIWGFFSVSLIASANYCINEYLDSEYDSVHPFKKNRPGARGVLKFPIVIVEYVLLISSGIFLGCFINHYFIFWLSLFIISGIIYNLEPIRTKDRVYLDVLSESFNSPIRLMLGWHIIAGSFSAPSSTLMSYWMGGAFLMSVKRLAEIRNIADYNIAGRYRRSFQFYTEEKLLLSSFFYGIMSCFFLGIFLIKYRIEFVLCFPFFSILFVWYLHIGLSYQSSAQMPELLYKEWKFIFFIFLLILSVIFAFTVDIPLLKPFSEPLNYNF